MGHNSYLIATLGNKGKIYARTRHNIGYMVFDKLVKSLNLNTTSLETGNLAIFEKDEKTYYFYKPLCYMNESGFYIKGIKDEFEVPTSQILVIHDDKDLSFGKIKFKCGGGSGGHRGVQSIIEQIGKDFIRLKLGIGVSNIDDTSEFVLSEFDSQELTILEELLMMAVQAIYIYIYKGLSMAMNLYNGKIVNV